MKTVLRTSTGLALAATLMLSACANLPLQLPYIGGTQPTPGPAPVATVCLVTDTAGLGDKSFNDTAWKGVTDAQAQLNVEGAYLLSKQASDYDVNINAFMIGGCDLIISVGYLIGEATARAATAHPEQKFAIVDFDFADFSTTPPTDVVYPNVKELTFRTDQAAFMAGYVAAAVTKTGKVGTFGGVKIPTVTIFMDGFALGVQHYNQAHGKTVTVLGWDPVLQTGLFTDTFDVVQEGVTMAESLVEEGADIIMPVAGGVGLGAAALAQQEGNVLIIGVDTDWTVSAPEYGSITLTSVLKKMDVAVLDTIRSVIDGTFQGGLYVGTLAGDGVGLSPFHQLDAAVPIEIRTELEQVKAEIIAGTLATSPAR